MSLFGVPLNSSETSPVRRAILTASKEEAVVSAVFCAMRNAVRGFVILAAAALMAPMGSEPSVAKIQCKGNFQVTKHGLIATPYCEEEQIARVARSYGWSGTAADVHNNPNTKVYLCQRFGRDNRLKGSCGAYGEVPWVPGR